MSGMKRFLMIVFGIAGVLCLGALVLPWVGPFKDQASNLLYNPYYFYTLLALVLITLAGLCAVLLRGLFAPPKRKTLVIRKAGDDKISVTTDAIRSQALHIVEADGVFAAEKVLVSNVGNGNVSVSIRVKPHYTVDLANEGNRLHDQLREGLTAICGDHVQHINLEFVEAENPIPALNARVEHEQLEVPASVYERAALMESEPAEVAAPPAPKVEAASAPAPAPASKPEPVATPASAGDLEVPASVYERAARMRYEEAKAKAKAAMAAGKEDDGSAEAAEADATGEWR